MSKRTSHLLTWVGVIAIVAIVLGLIVQVIELVIAIVLLAIAVPVAVIGIRKLRHHAHHQVTDERGQP